MTQRAVAGSGPARSIVEQADRLYREQLNAGYSRTDQLFAVLLLLEWLVAVAFALWISPYTWAGESVALHVHVWAAVILGGAIVSLPVTLALIRPGATTTRHAVAMGQMLMSALLIHLGGGRIEVHFHIFGSLAFLALYRDWKVLITASVIVAAGPFPAGHLLAAVGLRHRDGQPVALGRAHRLGRFRGCGAHPRLPSIAAGAA